MCRFRVVPVLVAVSVLATGASARADEGQILTDIKAFFETENLDQREALARRIESDPAYDRAKVGVWLNHADLFEPLQPGTTTLNVPLDTGQTRSVRLRIPEGYDAERPWPLLYALHGTHGTGDGILRYILRVLGDRVDEFVIAAPTGYGQAVVHAKGDASAEHPIVWRAIKKKVHVDSDRMYMMGYSLGGHTSWTLAILHADRFAAALPTAGSFMLPQLEKLWPPFLPNIANTHVLNSWGAGDVYGPDLKTPSPDGGIAQTNRTMREMAAECELDVVSFEDPDKGHGGITPPREMLDDALSRVRVQYPRTVEHSFRFPHQSQAYWIEAHDWRGKHWDEKPLTLKFRGDENTNDPEVQHEAIARAIRLLLGQVRGKIDGQNVDVRRKKVSELTIWFGDGMIDWDEPLSVKVSGRKAYAGRLEPDLFVCLSQAARTYDLQRLRWAGLRCKSGKKTRVVTGRTPFPAPGASD